MLITDPVQLMFLRKAGVPVWLKAKHETRWERCIGVVSTIERQKYFLQRFEYRTEDPDADQNN